MQRIDSNEQICRNQFICDEKTTILDYAAKHLPNLSIYELNKNDWKFKEYGFIICTNVLSAIPYENDRLSILKCIKNLLSAEGIALISVQFRNSYFKTYGVRMNAFPYEDGWIIYSGNRYSFYGIINPESLHRLLSDAGLHIMHRKIIDGSVYYIVS